MSPYVWIPLLTIIELLAFAIGFMSGALWFWSRWERRREQDDVIGHGL